MKLSMIAVVLALFAQAPAFAAGWPEACKPIEDACLKAGFKNGGAGEGLGIFVHCMKPLLKMPGDVKAKAKKKPPKVASAVLAACKKAMGAQKPGGK